jgi:hypothetical protein
MKCGHWRAIHSHGEGNFEGMRLVLGVAYVQPHEIDRDRLRVGKRCSYRLAILTDLRMYTPI